MKKGELKPAQERDLINALNGFSSWLYKKKISKQKSSIDKSVDFPSANEDWVMRVDGNSVTFNTLISQKCSFDYYKAIVLHESFHLEIQKLPNKEDATRVKDEFGDELMKLIDIEADFFTALYYKEVLGYGLVKYLQLYYEGRTAFSDRWIRAVKFERFIGTLLSIANLFISFPKKADKVTSYDLYLPTISPVYTEESLHVLIVRKEHIYFDEIKANHQDFVELKACYTNVDSLTAKGYVEKLINFVHKALNKEISQGIKNDINKIRN